MRGQSDSQGAPRRRDLVVTAASFSLLRFDRPLLDAESTNTNCNLYRTPASPAKVKMASVSGSVTDAASTFIWLGISASTIDSCITNVLYEAQRKTTCFDERA